MATDDYVLIKKNISLEEIFNAAFACGLVALFFSRLFYVMLHPSAVFLNPLGFFLFPYFPGLSLVGGVIGAAISLFVYSRRKKFPISRVFDFFTIALLFSLPPGLIGYILLSSDFSQGNAIKLVLFIAMFGLTSLYLYPKASSLEIKDGSLSILFLIFYPLVALLGNSIDTPGISNFMANKENFILLAFLILGVILIIKQEIAGRINFDR